MLDSAYANGITPVVNVLANGTCIGTTQGKDPVNTPAQWAVQMGDLIQYIDLNTQFLHTPRAIDFEIGNEPDNFGSDLSNRRGGVAGWYTDGAGFASRDGTFHFDDVFGAAASALDGAIQGFTNHGFGNYRIITGGMIGATTTTRAGFCTGQQSRTPGFVSEDNYDQVFVAGQAIANAVGRGVPRQHLVVGVHPYSYDTAFADQWHNYYGTPRVPYYTFDGPAPHGRGPVAYHAPVSGYNGICLDLGGMIKTWLHEGVYHEVRLPYPYGNLPPGYVTRFLPGDSFSFHDLPLFFTEDNYDSGEFTTPVLPDRPNSKVGHDGVRQAPINNRVAEGAYLADLMTWLYNHRCYMYAGGAPCSGGTVDLGRDAVRVLFFKGGNGPDVADGLLFSVQYDYNNVDPLHQNPFVANLVRQNLTYQNGPAGQPKPVTLNYCGQLRLGTSPLSGAPVPGGTGAPPSGLAPTDAARIFQRLQLVSNGIQLHCDEDNPRDG